MAGPAAIARRLPAVGAVVLALAAGVSISGCSVENATREGITVAFNAYHPELAQREATRHCAQFGRKAVLVSSEPGTPSLSSLFTRQTVNVYQCVEPAAPDSETQ
jgi:hypothetical protein